jgi:hypothetical protein
MLRLAWMLPMLGLLVGCYSGRVATVTVDVANASDGDVTLWMHKSGPPVETGWRSPGSFAVVAPVSPDGSDPANLPSVVLAPNDVIRLGPRRGTFTPQGLPVLRVFSGRPTLAEMAAVPMRASEAATIELGAGLTRLVVSQHDPVRVVPLPPATRPGGGMPGE